MSSHGEILPDDEVCACFDRDGHRDVRLYERCQSCGAFMEADYVAAALSEARAAQELLAEMLAPTPETRGLSKLQDIARYLDDADARLGVAGTEMQDDLRDWHIRALAAGCVQDGPGQETTGAGDDANVARGTDTTTLRWEK